VPSAEDLVDFYIGLERGLKLGVPPRKGIENVVALARTPFFRGVLGGLWVKMGEGESFSSALKLFPEVFDKATIALIQAGEKMGDLRPIFRDVAKVQGQAHALMKKIRAGMMYPAFILSMTVGAIMILGWKVIPEMGKTYKSMGVKLPSITTALVWCSETMLAYPWLLLIPPAVGYFLWIKKEQILGHPRMERALLEMPIFGPVLRGAVLVRTLRSLALLIQSGVNTKDAFDIVADASDNKVYEAYFRAVGMRAMSGEGLPSAFLRERARIPVEGYIIANYVKLGQFVNDIPATIKGFSDQLDDDVQAKAEALPRLLEPVLIVFLTVGVGGVIAAVYLPYFTLLLEIMKKTNSSG
jgi:type II secretory pathway component PulF